MVLSKKINLDTFMNDYKYDYECKHYSEFYQLLNTLKLQILKNPDTRGNKDWTLFDSSGKSIKLSVSELYIQLVLFIPNLIYRIPIRSDRHIYNVHEIVTKGIDNVMEDIILQLLEAKKDKQNPALIGFVMSDIIFELNDIASAFGIYATLSLSLYDIIQLGKRMSEFNSILYSKLRDDMSYDEAEKVCKEMGNRLQEIVIKDGTSYLSTFMETDIINKVQMTQMFAAVGPRSNIDTTIIPRIIKDSYINGLDTASEYFTDSISCRLALMLKYLWLAKSGYLSRKFDLLTNGTYVVGEDCGSKHYLEYKIITNEHLMFAHKKYMVLSNGKLKSINAYTDKHLIGKTVNLRTSITCLNQRGRICRTCYGDYPSYRLINPGALASISWINKLSGNAMSAKHKQNTNTIIKPIVKLLEFLNYEAGNYTLKDDLEYNNLSLVFDISFITNLIEKYGYSDDDESELDTDNSLSSTIDHITLKNEDGEIEVIELDNMKLNLSDEFIGELASNKRLYEYNNVTEEVTIKLANLSSGLNIFETVFITEEVSKFLIMISEILERKKGKYYTSYNQMVEDLIHVSYLSKSDVELAIVEIIVHNVIRDPINKKFRPDFTVKDPKFTLLPLNKAIEKSCVSTNLFFQNIKSLHRDIDNYLPCPDGMFSDLLTSRKEDHYLITKQDWHKEAMALSDSIKKKQKV